MMTLVEPDFSPQVEAKIVRRKEKEERLTLLIVVTLKEENDFITERAFLITGDLEEIFKVVPFEENVLEKIRKPINEAITPVESSGNSAST